MNVRGINWQIWAGFVLSLIAFLSYPFVFVWFPLTRDFPWGSLLIFAIAAVLVFMGMRRAFSPDCPHPKRSKIVGSIVTVLSFAIFGLFIVTAFIGARQLPASKGAPQIGQKAPDFTLADTSNKQVSLAELTSTPVNGKATKGVLLIFYRGYW